MRLYKVSNQNLMICQLSPHQLISLFQHLLRIWKNHHLSSWRFGEHHNLNQFPTWLAFGVQKRRLQEFHLRPLSSGSSGARPRALIHPLYHHSAPLRACRYAYIFGVMAPGFQRYKVRDQVTTCQRQDALRIRVNSPPI